jgi:hypothetical protein
MPTTPNRVGNPFACFTVVFPKVAARLESIDFATIVGHSLSPFDDVFYEKGEQKYI